MTLKQHVFPESAIRRFCGPTNKVQVWFRSGPESNATCTHNGLHGPNEPIFLADGVWDQGTEDWAAKIEREYDAVARKFDRPINGGIEALDILDSQSVTLLYRLWQSRSVIRHMENPHKPIELVGLQPNRSLSPLDLEQCRNLGVTVAYDVGPNGFGAVTARTVYGLQVRRGMTHFELMWGVIKWACVERPSANLIVPDECKEMPYVPLSPTRCFVAIENSPLPGPAQQTVLGAFRAIRPQPFHTGTTIHLTDTGLNDLAKRNSRRYYFQSP